MRGASARVWDASGSIPIHTVAIAASIVLLMWAAHAGEMVRGSPLPALAVAVGLGAGLAVIGAAVTRDPRRGAIVGTAGVVATLAHGHIWSGSLLGWPGVWSSLALVVLVASRVRSLDDEPVTRMTRAANLLGVVAVVACSTGVVLGGSTARAKPMETALPSSDPTAHRDLVWIVPDRYGGRAALETRFGTDDAGLGEELRQRGFAVGVDVRANYPRTTHSLAAQWNLAYLDDVVEELPTSAGRALTPLYPLLGDHSVGRQLTDRGYEYTHLGTWFDPTRTAATATDTRVLDDRSEFGLVVEWLSILPPLTGRGPTSIDTGRETRQAAVTTHQLDELEAVARELVENPDDPPRLVIAHIALPHEPFVFDADGGIATTPGQPPRPWDEGYDDQLRFFNDRLLDVVDTLLAGGDEHAPVILVQADEGPHPRALAARESGWTWSDATDDELVTKLSILSAVYSPDAALELEPGTTAVNVARQAVGAAVGVRLDALPDRSYVYVDEQNVYSFLDVTDRLDAAIDSPGG